MVPKTYEGKLKQSGFQSKNPIPKQRRRFTMDSGLLYLPARGRQGFSKEQTKTNPPLNCLI